MRYLSTLCTPGVHEVEIRAHFQEKALYTGNAPIFDKPLYLLAFVNRSGSNLLAEYLRMTPRLRGFREQLIFSTVKQFCMKNNISEFPDYLQAISKAAQDMGQAYGLKASWDQILMLYRFGIFNMYPSVRVVHIQREDILGQAVSYQIALQTKQWTSEHKATGSQECHFDADQISQIIGSVIDGNHLIAQVCAILDLPRATVSYESLVAAPGKVIRELAPFIEQNLSKWEPKTPKISKQTSSLNEQFRQQYLSYAREALQPD